MTLSLTEVNNRLEAYYDTEFKIGTAESREKLIDELQDIILLLEKKHAAEKISGIYDKKHRIDTLSQEVILFEVLSNCNVPDVELSEYRERLKIANDEIKYIENIIALKSNTIYIEE